MGGFISRFFFSCTKISEDGKETGSCSGLDAQAINGTGTDELSKGLCGPGKMEKIERQVELLKLQEGGSGGQVGEFTSLPDSAEVKIALPLGERSDGAHLIMVTVPIMEMNIATTHMPPCIVSAVAEVEEDEEAVNILLTEEAPGIAESDAVGNEANQEWSVEAIESELSLDPYRSCPEMIVEELDISGEKREWRFIDDIYRIYREGEPGVEGMEGCEYDGTRYFPDCERTRRGARRCLRRGIRRSRYMEKTAGIRIAWTQLKVALARLKHRC